MKKFSILAACLIIVFPCLGMAPPNDKQDFYYKLASYWAPDLYQDTGHYPEGDYITAFDGDGDWKGANNLESLKAGRFGPYHAYVYYQVIETRTHYLIIYEVFHPFDYDHPLLKCLEGAYHENDTEATMVIVQKMPGKKFGRFRGLETRPHGYTRYYALDSDVRPPLFKLIEKPSLRDGHHPEIYIQRGGHGPYALHAREHGLFYRHEFHADTGVVYRYKGEAQAPSGPDDRDVGYELIAIDGERGFWPRRCEREAFDKRREYKPPQGRPGIPRELLCDDGKLPFNLNGDDSGDSGSIDSGGLPWNHLTPDPAHLVDMTWKFPEAFSTEYVYNPFLGIDRRDKRENR